MEVGHFRPAVRRRSRPEVRASRRHRPRGRIRRDAKRRERWLRPCLQYEREITTSPSSRAPTTARRTSPRDLLAVDRKAQHVGRLVLAAELAVELVDPELADDSIATWPSSTPSRSSVAAAAPMSDLRVRARLHPSINDQFDLERCRSALVRPHRRRRRPDGRLPFLRDWRCFSSSSSARRTRRRSAARACAARRLLVKAHKRDVVDVFENLADFDQTRTVAARQVDLRDVAGDDDLRAEAEAREEHLHLLGGGVLGLVEDHERVIQGATSQEGQRRDFDRAALRGTR